MLRFACFLMVCSAATAGQIAVSSVTASSTFVSYDVDNLINGQGLSGGLHDTNFQHMWMDDSAVDTAGTPSLIFNLGSVFTVSTADVWNYNAVDIDLHRGVKDFTISTSTDGVHYSSLGSFTLAEGTGNPLAAQAFSLGGASAEFIEFNVIDNYGGNYTGLSAAQFFSSSSTPTPEPSTFLLATLAIGLIRIRRRA